MVRGVLDVRKMGSDTLERDAVRLRDQPGELYGLVQGEPLAVISGLDLQVDGHDASLGAPLSGDGLQDPPIVENDPGSRARDLSGLLFHYGPTDVDRCGDLGGALVR